MNASIDSLALHHASDWSRLIVLAKRFSTAGLVVIGLIGGSILIGEWPDEVPGKHDGHNDTTEMRDGPARVVITGISSATTINAATVLTQQR